LTEFSSSGVCQYRRAYIVGHCGESPTDQAGLGNTMNLPQVFNAVPMIEKCMRVVGEVTALSWSESEAPKLWWGAT
jgi:hypothetical protein